MPTPARTLHNRTADRPEDGDFKSELLALIPFLRAFARSLTGNQEGADDLAQETLVKAWQSRATFIPGTNLKAWLFTILRNQFYSDRRRAWRQAPWDQEAAERIPGGGEDQFFSAQLSDTARALRRLLDRDGHQVTTAYSVDEAMERLKSDTFDLLLSDIGLPDGTGLDLIRKARAISNLPAVALTGFGMEEDVRSCHQAGFDEHLTKPINFQKLEFIIQHLMQNGAHTN